MGIANHYLIPQAVLLDNPGVTREEYIGLLDSVKFTFSVPEYSEKDPWNSHDDFLRYYYSDNLGHFADMMGIKKLSKGVYDWNQIEGEFESRYDHTPNFFWKQVEGKFYFDLKTFDMIPASFGSEWIIQQESFDRRCEFGYTDLILTAEAIKQKAWKLLSYRGMKHNDQFLRDFSDSRRRYFKAVWDSHTSLASKLKGTTYSEFLRFRLLPPNAR